MIKVSAPGKIHLIGEHAVVYGQPAILASLNKRTYVSIGPSENVQYLELAWPEISQSWKLKELFKLTQRTFSLWNTCNNKKDFSELFDFIKKNSYEGYRASVLGIAIKMLRINQGFLVKIDSQIPVGVGLGSSASRAVAITQAMAEFFQKKISLEKINEIAYEQEKIIHGTPSGGDNSTCCFGGLLWFRKAQPENEIKSLKKEVPYKLENFVLVQTGEPRKATGELVQLVRNLDESYRDKRIKEIGKMTFEMLKVLKKKDFERMKEIINQTQKNLAELGVSTPPLDKLAKAIREIGGAAKLSGAGGGGGMVLCWHEDKKKLKETINELGFEPIETELAVEGVRIEKK